MLLDFKAKFSEAQALTGTANSTNVYDQSAAAGLAVAGVRGFLHIAAKGGTTPTIKVEIKGADDEAISTNVVTVGETAVLSDPVLDVVDVPIRYHPPKRYYRATYTLGGTSPTFTVSCGLTDGNFQTNLKTIP